MNDVLSLPETPFERFVAPAGDAISLLRFAFHFILIIFLVFLWIVMVSLPFLILLVFAVKPSLESSLAMLSPLSDFARYLSTSVFIVPYILTMVFGIYPAVWLVTKLQKQPLITVIGVRGMDREFWKDFAISFGVLAVCIAFGVGASFMDESRVSVFVKNLDFMKWFMLLPLMLVVIFLQSGAEEVLFRGYLFQQCAARWRHPIAWMVIPSIIFAILHYNPAPNVDNAFMFIIVIFSFFFGVFAADLTRLTGSIGAAWGMHFANNFFGISVIALETEDLLDSVALYTNASALNDQFMDTDMFQTLNLDVLYGFVAMFFAWIILRRLLPYTQKKHL